MFVTACVFSYAYRAMRKRGRHDATAQIKRDKLLGRASNLFAPPPTANQPHHRRVAPITGIVRGGHLDGEEIFGKDFGIGGGANRSIVRFDEQHDSQTAVIGVRPVGSPGSGAGAPAPVQ